MAENFLENKQSELEAPQGLMSKIMSRLEQERRLRSLRRRLVLAVISFIPLLTVALPVWRNWWLDFQSSGLVDYLSLITTDAKMVLINWQNFSLGFLESFPVVSTVAVLSVLLAWLVAISLAVKYGQEFKKLRLQII